MIDSRSFEGLRLRGGFIVDRVEFAVEPMVDEIGRPALARTQIMGSNLKVTVVSGLHDKETSVTLYHEILEALTVGSLSAPRKVRDFNEADFDRAAYEAHERFGPVSPEGLNRML